MNEEVAGNLFFQKGWKIVIRGANGKKY
jgi:hypothetical protein